MILREIQSPSLSDLAAILVLAPVASGSASTCTGTCTCRLVKCHQHLHPSQPAGGPKLFSCFVGSLLFFFLVSSGLSLSLSPPTSSLSLKSLHLSRGFFSPYLTIPCLARYEYCSSVSLRAIVSHYDCCAPSPHIYQIVIRTVAPVTAPARLVASCIGLRSGLSLSTWFFDSVQCSCS